MCTDYDTAHFSGFRKKFSQTCSTFSSRSNDCPPDLLALCKQPSLKILSTKSKFICQFKKIKKKNVALKTHSIVLVDCVRTYSKTQNEFSFGHERHGSTWKQNKSKVSNIEFWFLSIHSVKTLGYFNKNCQNYWPAKWHPIYKSAIIKRVTAPL